MVNSSLLRWAGLLAFVGCLVAVTNCHDFEEAFEQCQDAGLCFPDEDNDGVDDRLQDAGTDAGPTRSDAGTDAGPTGNDGGPDAGPSIPGDIKEGDCDAVSGLCLRHKYPISGDYELYGLWGSNASEVFLAARSPSGSPAQFVRFTSGTFAASAVADTRFQPFRLHGSSPSNVWAINKTGSVTACTVVTRLALPDGGEDVQIDAGLPVGEPDAGTPDAGTPDAGEPDAGPIVRADAGTGTLTCPSPVFRLTGSTWTNVPYGDGTSQLQPRAIFAAEPDRAWAATTTGDLVQWSNNQWTSDPPALGADAETWAFWGDASSLLLAVGKDSSMMGAYWRHASGTRSTVASGTLVAIAGPNENHLYAASASEVFRWNVANAAFELEPSASNQGSGEIQDLWVSGDGNEVWVVRKNASVLRKRGSTWEAVPLPVAPTFTAYRIIGFDSTDRDLWITGTHASQAFTGTIAYHFSRQP